MCVCVSWLSCGPRTVTRFLREHEVAHVAQHAGGDGGVGGAVVAGKARAAVREHHQLTRLVEPAGGAGALLQSNLLLGQGAGLQGRRIQGEHKQRSLDSAHARGGGGAGEHAATQPRPLPPREGGECSCGGACRGMA